MLFNTLDYLLVFLPLVYIIYLLIIKYKNISLLKKYVSDNGKIMSSKITSVSFNKQKKLTREIKKAKILGLI